MRKLARYRKALKHLNNKLETLDGVLHEYEDDSARILSGRLTASEYTRASTVKQGLDFDDSCMFTYGSIPEPRLPCGWGGGT